MEEGRKGGRKGGRKEGREEGGKREERGSEGEQRVRESWIGLGKLCQHNFEHNMIHAAKEHIPA